jgi:uncharacterized membrane protein YeiH
MKIDSGKLLLVIDLVGTFLFGMEGAAAAIANNLDLLGLMVLAFATALGGGIVRDLLIGAVPPGALHDWRYSAAAFTGGAIMFFLHRFVFVMSSPAIMVLDAGGSRPVRRRRHGESAHLQDAPLHRHFVGNDHRSGRRNVT